jgi:hypothetical protein
VQNSFKAIKAFANLAIVLTLLTTAISYAPNAEANAIPEAARLIGNGGNSRSILNTNSASATDFAKCASSTGIRGITSDGTYVYYRPSGDSVICKTTLSGTFVSAHTVINNGQALTFQNYSSESRALTFANGCILFRGGGTSVATDKGYAAGSDFMCVDTTNWTMYGPFTPNGNGIPAGGGWLSSNIMNFPDGRVGAVSAPNAGVGTGPACSTAYCKYSTTLQCFTYRKFTYIYIRSRYNSWQTQCQVGLTMIMEWPRTELIFIK